MKEIHMRAEEAVTNVETQKLLDTEKAKGA